MGKPWTALLGVIAVLVCFPCDARPIRTQTVELKAGWNAVYLQVDPERTDPNSMFQGTPIEIAARYFVPQSSVQFISDPSDTPWNIPEWGVWYAPERADAFLTSLHAIHGGQSYLIRSKENFHWNVSGLARSQHTAWKLRSYNLIGFSLDQNKPPTFQEFLQGAGGNHLGRRILRLESDKWKLVTDPSTSRMRDGEAYWIYGEGQTDYPGPLSLPGTPVDGLLFSAVSTRNLVLQNNLKHKSRATLELIQGNNTFLTVEEAQTDFSTLTTTYRTLPSKTELELGPSSSVALTWRVHPNDARPSASALVKITMDNGAVQWVPITTIFPTAQLAP